MLPRQDAGPFTVGRGVTVTDDGVRLWSVLFHGRFVGYTRRPGDEIDQLNARYREARAKRRREAGPYYPRGEQ
jgi:hypothetical protein